MQVSFSKRFLKQLAKLPADIREKIEYFVFTELPSCESLQQVGSIEKMRGYDGYYKIRFGVYRVGLKQANGIIIIQVVMHRKEIYRYFPSSSS